MASGFVRVSLASGFLGFETAAIAGWRSCGPCFAPGRGRPSTTNPEETVATDAACLFCRIVRGEIPATLVYETPEVVAFRDINPQSPYHVVIIPRDHVASLNDVGDAAVVGRLALAATALAKREGFADQGYRTVINTNSNGGQTVYHLHMHLLAGRHHAWPPG